LLGDDKMHTTDEKIIELNLSDKLNKKLNSLGLIVINDIWVLKRKDLKEKGLTDSEIKSIIIALQLKGLDLNKKIYD
jgi:plastocyanin domain-containing protein